jgi:hypothetical protein
MRDGTEHRVHLRIIGPDGKSQAIPAELKTEFIPKLEPDTLPGGATVIITLRIDVKTTGAFYVVVLMDDEELCRAPFSIARPVEANRDSQVAT